MNGVRRMRVLFFKKKWLLQGAAMVVVLAVAIIFATAAPSAPAFFGAKEEYQIKSVKTQEKCVAITVDTAFGQEDYTSDILAALNEEGVHATFAVMGLWAEEHPEQMQQIASSKCEIISHSYAHERYGALSGEAIQQDAKRAQQSLAQATGKDTFFIRVPYDDCSKETYLALEEAGFIPVGYAVDAQDTQSSVEEIVQQVLEEVKPGDIILFQNNNPQAASAMAEIIQKLKSLGYRFETVSGLLGEHYTVNAQGIAIPAKPAENS